MNQDEELIALFKKNSTRLPAFLPLDSLLKAVKADELCLHLTLHSQLLLHHLTNGLLSLELLVMKGQGSQLAKRTLNFKQKIELDSFELFQFLQTSLANVLGCWQIIKEQKSAFLSIKPNKFRQFLKRVKALCPWFCTGQSHALTNPNEFTQKVLKLAYPSQSKVKEKLAVKIRRLTIMTCKQMQANIVNYFLQQQDHQQNQLLAKVQPIIEIPVLSKHIERVKYRQCNGSSSSRQGQFEEDRFADLFGMQQLDLLSDEIENIMINRALNLLYMPRRRYSQEYKEQQSDKLSVARSGKVSISHKFFQMLKN